MIDKLRELHERATPGPWSWVEARQSYHVLAGPLKDIEFPISDENMVLTDGSAGGEYPPDIDVNGPNAQLIVAMRNNLDKLLALVEAVRSGIAHADYCTWHLVTERECCCLSQNAIKALAALEKE